MKNNTLFGTYDVPSMDVSLSATYTVSGTLSTEQKAIFCDDKMYDQQKNTFDTELTGTLKVTKPKK